MQKLFSIGGSLLAIFLFIQFARLCTGTVRLIKITLWAPLFYPASRDDLGELLPLFDMARTRLAQEGFHYLGTQRRRSIVAQQNLPEYCIEHFHHPAHDILAEVSINEMADVVRPYIVTFKNCFTDGSALFTSNNPAIEILPPLVRVVRSERASIADVTNEHLQARARITVPRCPTDGLRAEVNTVERNLFAEMVRAGQAYQSGRDGAEPIYRFRVLHALQMTWCTQRNYDRVRRKPMMMEAPQVLPPPNFIAALLAAQKQSMLRTICTLRGLRSPAWLQAASLAITFPASIAIGAWWWDIETALAVVLVIAIHEGGHWLAMRLAGFRDVQVFFVPGFGGATVGEKHEAHPMMHVLVFLAGPLPGLMLAFLLAFLCAMHPDFKHAAWYPFLAAAGSASIFINLFNLLPVMPLDGGRIVDQLLFARFPWLRFAFAVASGVGLFAFGWAMDSTLTEVLGGVLLLASRSQFRLAQNSNQLNAYLRKTHDHAGGEGKSVKHLIEFLFQSSMQARPYAEKLNFALTLLPRYFGRLPGWKSTLGGLLLYAAAVFIPLAGLAVAMFAAPVSLFALSGQHRSSSAELRAQYIQNAKLDREETRKQRAIRLDTGTATGRMARLKSAIDNAREANDYQDAARLAETYYTESAALAAPAMERADAALCLAQALQGKAEFAETESDATAPNARIKQLAMEAETIERSRLQIRDNPRDAILLASALLQIEQVAEREPSLPMQKEIVKLYASALPANDERLIGARMELAKSFDEAGQLDEAEAQLRTNVATSATLPESLRYQKMQAKMALAWLLLEQNKTAEASNIATLLSADSDERWFTASAHRLLWVAAGRQGNWQEAKIQAESIEKSRSRAVGNWFIRLMVRAQGKEQDRDPDNSLHWIKIETERMLGKNHEADALLKEVRENIATHANEYQGVGSCPYQSVSYRSGEVAYFSALREIEQRELKCATIPPASDHLQMPQSK